MKFENTKRCLLIAIPVCLSPVVGSGLAYAYTRYGQVGGIVASAILGFIVMVALGIYQDYEAKSRSSQK